jgi:hypothetical protein
MSQREVTASLKMGKGSIWRALRRAERLAATKAA